MKLKLLIDVIDKEMNHREYKEDEMQNMINLMTLIELAETDLKIQYLVFNFVLDDFHLYSLKWILLSYLKENYLPDKESQALASEIFLNRSFPYYIRDSILTILLIRTNDDKLCRSLMKKVLLEPQEDDFLKARIIDYFRGKLWNLPIEIKISTFINMSPQIQRSILDYFEETGNLRINLFENIIMNESLQIRIREIACRVLINLISTNKINFDVSKLEALIEDTKVDDFLRIFVLQQYNKKFSTPSELLKRILLNQDDSTILRIDTVLYILNNVDEYVDWIKGLPEDTNWLFDEIKTTRLKK